MRRLQILALVLGLWLLLIPARLVQLQVARYGEFTQRAARQQLRTIEVAPRRGIIFDRNGNELAMSVTVESVFAVPQEIEKPALVASQLARILQTDARAIETRLRSSRAFAWVARKVDADVSESIRKLNLKGIYFQKEPKRFYPKRELAAQVLGYVGMDDEGLGGIERAYDERLRGRPGRMLITQDARRRWFGSVERQPEPGENVVLTLDEKIQYIAERELERAVKQTRAAAGTVIVQNPRTGEILALANYPTFNPNRFRRASPELMKNRAVSDIYEPGSTFKIVTVAAALEEKLTQPDEVFDCQMGAIVIHGRRIRDHKPFGMLSVAQILAHSSGVGAIKIGLRLGEPRLDKYIRAFGFGSHTGLELPGETRGYTKPPERWSRVSIGAISMGQEIGVSAVQVASMVSTIANDGVWTAPRIVAGTTAGAAPQTILFQPGEQRRVVSALTAVQMKQMLEGVVLFGTSRKAILNGYTSAGKSGTAQKADPTTGTYSKTKFVASFAGFAPVREPAITVAVIIDSPVGERGGGKIAGPVFARVAQQVLAYLNVPQDVAPRSEQERVMRAAARTPDSEIFEGVPDRVGEGLAVADAAEVPAVTAPAAEPALEAALLGPAARPPAAGRAAARAPERPDPVTPPPSLGGTVVIVDVAGGVEVPSFVGKPLRAAIELAQEAGLELDAIGSGIAQEQAPPAGSRISPGARVAVRFAR